MSSKQDKGLEAGKILEDLEQEVPTAAYQFKCPICSDSLVYNGDISGNCVNCERKFDREETVDELVTSEKMREALKEAVQQARQRERRRIRENIEKFKDSVESKAELQKKEHDAVQETVRAEIKTAKYLIKELEE